VIQLTLPSPPSLNSLYGRSKMGVYKKKEHSRYIEQIQKILILNKILPLQGDLSLTMTWYRAKRRGDLDNIFKTIWDGLAIQTALVNKKRVPVSKYALFENDSQITVLVARKDYDKKNPRVEIECQQIL